MASGNNSVNRHKGNFYITDRLTPTEVATDIWVAPRHCILRNVREVHSVVGGASAAIRPRKITGTSAPGAVASATVVELTTSIDLTTTINTVVTPTLVSTQSARHWRPPREKRQ
jgi:hypothetical protein